MSTPTSRHRSASDQASTWSLQDAKARLSEVVRRARTDGPQHVTVHGRDEAVVMSAEEFRRLQGGQSGQALIDALQACPYPGLVLDPELESVRTDARDVDL